MTPTPRSSHLTISARPQKPMNLWHRTLQCELIERQSGSDREDINFDSGIERLLGSRLSGAGLEGALVVLDILSMCQ
jgi:hypothetical protein